MNNLLYNYAVIDYTKKIMYYKKIIFPREYKIVRDIAFPINFLKYFLQSGTFHTHINIPYIPFTD